MGYHGFRLQRLIPPRRHAGIHNQARATAAPIQETMRIIGIQLGSHLYAAPLNTTDRRATSHKATRLTSRGIHRTMNITVLITPD